ncbi:MAG: F0F1 ATP synthase subunit B [bacterium]|nr:F0F1 ATP synthase subunit B [bacterium]
MLGLTPHLTIPAIFLVLLLMWILNLWLYRPLLKTLDDRKTVLDGAAADAAGAEEQIAALQQEYDDALAEARRDAKSVFSAAHEKAMAAEEQILGEAHQQAAKIMEKGMNELGKSVDLAKEELEQHATALSGEIGSKILGRTLQ